MVLVLVLSLEWSLLAAQSERKADSPMPPRPALALGTLLKDGPAGETVLRRQSLIDSRALTQNAMTVVYAGARDPLFQVVLWGKDREHPERLLIEFDPKKQSLPGLLEFNADWNTHFAESAASASTLEAFFADTASHLKAYCGQLPPGARCEVRTWNLTRTRVIRADIHLRQGPPVPKAIEITPKK